MKSVKIYCLCDPETCKIRYIGRTSKNVLYHRLIEHITKSKYHNKYYPGKKAPHRVNWINSLLSKGLEPKIRLLTIIKGWKESHLFEREIITKYKNKYNLVNSEDRGEGCKNRIIADDQKQLISESLKKYYKKEENKEHLYKVVHVYNTDGSFFKTFKSAMYASEELDIPLIHVRKMKGGSTKHPKYGYYFSGIKYDLFPVIKTVHPLHNRIRVFDKITKKEYLFSNFKSFLKEFNFPNYGKKTLIQKDSFKKFLLFHDIYFNEKLYLPSV